MKSYLSNIPKRSPWFLRRLTIVAVLFISQELTNTGAPLHQDPNATLPKLKPTTTSNSNNANNAGRKKAKRRRRSSAVTVAREQQRHMQSEQDAADTTAGVVAREQQRRMQAEQAAADATAAAANERQRRMKAEQETAEARAAQERAEKEVRRRKDVWLMATVRNLTKGPITYQVLCNDSWSPLTLGPGYETVYVCLNGDISLKYDYKYAAGVQERIYRLEGTPVVGHRPTDEEKARARVNFFQVNANGDIGLFSNP